MTMNGLYMDCFFEKKMRNFALGLIISKKKQKTVDRTCLQIVGNIE